MITTNPEQFAREFKNFFRGINLAMSGTASDMADLAETEAKNSIANAPFSRPTGELVNSIDKSSSGGINWTVNCTSAYGYIYEDFPEWVGTGKIVPAPQGSKLLEWATDVDAIDYDFQGEGDEYVRVGRAQFASSIFTKLRSQGGIHFMEGAFDTIYADSIAILTQNLRKNIIGLTGG